VPCRHNEALEHAHAAVVLLQEELSQMEVTGDYSRDSSPETLNKMAVLAISYHNIGRLNPSRHHFCAVLHFLTESDNFAFAPHVSPGRCGRGIFEAYPCESGGI